MRSVAVAALIAALGCKTDDPPPITSAWTESFERAELGGNYRPTTNTYQIKNGSLSAQGAFNHPLWLRKQLPPAVSIELDCWSNTSDGDIKVELYGDGESHATDKGAYTSTGYVVIMGGWNNSKSIIARHDEHGRDVAQRQAPKVVQGRRYHWKIVRSASTLEWYVDDMETPFLTLADSAPLGGTGHEYFGFNNWQSDSWFDNLTVTPL